MPRKNQTSTAQGLASYQSDLERAVDGVVDQVEDHITDRVVTRLNNFLNGGLQARVATRMQPHHDRFRAQLEQFSGQTTALGLTGTTIDAEVARDA